MAARAISIETIIRFDSALAAMQVAPINEELTSPETVEFAMLCQIHRQFLAKYREATELDDVDLINTTLQSTALLREIAEDLEAHALARFTQGIS